MGEKFLSVLSRDWFVSAFCVLLGAFPHATKSIDNFTLSPAGLFESEELLDITINGPYEALFADRKDEPQYFEFKLSAGGSLNLPLKIKTRGHFRRDPKNCAYPPLLLDFKKSEIPEESIFSGQNKLKLVMPCRGDKYVIREYLAYRLYNLITPLSFRARLIKVTFKDEDNSEVGPLYGILLEDEDQMASRNNAKIIKTDQVRPKQIERNNFLDLAIFEFLIGNTDWSIQFRQNIKLVEVPDGSQPKAVPYDFDHSGLVLAPYAYPAPELKLGSVRARRYRGYCMPDMDIYNERLEIFRKKHPDFLNVIDSCVHLDDKSKKISLKYLEQFQDIINDPKSWQQAFNYPCDEDGTGNVVIKGLRN